MLVKEKGDVAGSRKHGPGRTLMRSPVVKRQTLPMSGLLAFFRSFRPGAVNLWQRVVPSCPLREQTARACTKHLLRRCHHGWGMAEQLRLVLCGLETSLYPHTVLCKGMAEQLGFARELQVRERGRPRPPWMTSTIYEEARAGVQATAREQGRTPLSFCAFYDAGGDGFAQDGLQADPRRVQGGRRLTRSAPRALEQGGHGTDRAAQHHGVDRACHLVGPDGQGRPWPGFFSKRVRHGWPWALWRSNSTAASEKAHGSEACPRFCPEGP